MRRRAIAVFADIDDTPSRSRLAVLANDAEPRVASTARVSLALLILSDQVANVFAHTAVASGLDSGIDESLDEVIEA